jgi:hypothetical protein
MLPSGSGRFCTVAEFVVTLSLQGGYSRAEFILISHGHRFERFVSEKLGPGKLQAAA